VDEVAGPAALDRWLRNSGTSFAVCDVTSSDGLFALGRLLATCPDVLVAGTAEAIGSLLVSPTPTRTSPPVPVDGSVVVVCGSLHEAARAQLGVLAGRAIDDVVVIASQGDMTRPVSADAARTIAAALARQAHEAVAARRPAALVIVGGDTAAAVLGDVVLASLGTVGPGAAASSALDGGPLVVTRSGSFGAAQALVDLMRAIMGR
ncbi:MAG: hypothetical protein H0W46_10090, partial [Acidimicrobiia bacterium]|nr:hypothetical protein [Acidimicrobiia bacterium]